ncbi:DsbA family protein [Candidatus Nitrosarchaeum limnium]|uniref:DSBA-like thioredoxin domain protein n=1 Tax=Candidatus Nitrosarchaeum limnium BG20 TaxID=859192 RepID=S2E065_9ARCH|nr:thioredoxin domain-containing protein [Candidatus Nitrosarchaeum limnium]EPA04323.1 DSBA-like thioredoxin domain protein [Candidatus Nitrosarchaeum limnium BG20]
MGKKRQNVNKNNPKSNTTKFIIIGVIIAIAGAVLISTNYNSESQSNKLSIDTTKGSPVLGESSAPITIIEFGDYQCPFCQKWNQNTKPLIDRDYISTGKVKLIYVDFPIVGPDSINAHAGSYCADEQGLYWQYHDFLYKNQGHENSGWVSMNNLKNIVSGMEGMDVNLFSNCIDSGKYNDRVKENKNIAVKNGAKSTPSFIVIGPNGHGVAISGAQPYSVFKQTIDEMMT